MKTYVKTVFRINFVKAGSLSMHIVHTNLVPVHVNSFLDRMFIRASEHNDQMKNKCYIYVMNPTILHNNVQ